MKTKKISLILALLAIFSILASSPVYAANQWYTCTVDSTGPHFNGNMYLRLTDTEGSFTGKWFIAPADYANQYLAAALTALSNGNEITIYVDAALSYPTLRCIYILE
jgi:hypothetical protein